MIKLREYLLKSVEKTLISEEKISKTEENMIYHLIESPKKSKFSLKTYPIETMENTMGITFKYNVEFDELTSKLVDICDTLGYKFTSNIDHQNNIIEFDIYLS